MITIKILGCGSSLGVPVVGCNCQVCLSKSKYNKRLKSSILIESNNKNILVDFGCDIRQQLLRENIKKIDAAILTHIHADHVSGIDDLRPFHMFFNHPTIPIYTSHTSDKLFQSRFPYLKPEKLKKQFFKINPIKPFDLIKIHNIHFQFFNQNHGSIDSLGFKINNFVYANDLVNLYKESEQYFYNLEALILDCIDYKGTPSHIGLETVLKWNIKFKPQKIFLTNMSHIIDYDHISKILPQNIIPLYDGQKIKI